MTKKVWRCLVTYPNKYAFKPDVHLEKALGDRAGSGCFLGPDGERDIDWIFPTQKEAKDAAAKAKQVLEAQKVKGFKVEVNH